MCLARDDPTQTTSKPQKIKDATKQQKEGDREEKTQIDSKHEILRLK
jgi:hypothetical protein